MMATSLMTEPCGQDCDQEAEYLVSFVVKSLDMRDSEESQEFTDVQVVISWDGNVVKLSNNDPDAEVFGQGMDLVIHSTAKLISKKLKFQPIMFNLSRGCTELGTHKLDISKCFADAVLCNEFNSQTVTDDFDFIKDGAINASMTAYFRIQKKFDHQALNSNMNASSKKKKKTNAKRNVDSDDLSDGEDDLETSSDDEGCNDFDCTDEKKERCKRELGLHENVYRIINGHLINIKDRIGPCREKCAVAEKYIKELSKARTDPMAPTRFKFDHGFSKCCDLFEPSESLTSDKPVENCPSSPSCGGNVIVKPKSAKLNYSPVKSCKNGWIDKKFQEEDLLKKLCEKYQIDVEDIRAVCKNQPLQEVKPRKERKMKKLKDKKIKKAKKSASPCDPTRYTKTTRAEFIKLMQSKARGKYSYDFGNNYPLHRECLNVEQGAGDAPMVPRFMGWRWDKPMLGIHNKKWYPGMINRTVHCLMKHSLNPFPYDKISLTLRDKNGRVVKKCNEVSRLLKFNPDLVQKPTLQISKRNGEYFIKMNPLKCKDKLETDCNPFLKCSPLEFRIKKHPEEIKKHRARKLLRERGLTKKCSCLNIICCRCISETTKKLMAYQMKKVSDQFKLDKELDFDDLSVSSDSELELEFTTPSAMINERKCKPDVVHWGTQCEMKHFISMPDSNKLKQNDAKKKAEKNNPKKKSSVADKKKKSEKESKKMIEKMNSSLVGDQNKKPKHPIVKARVESIYVDPPCKPAPICRPVDLQTCRPLWC